MIFEDCKNVIEIIFSINGYYRQNFQSSFHKPKIHPMELFFFRFPTVCIQSYWSPHGQTSSTPLMPMSAHTEGPGIELP